MKFSYIPIIFLLMFSWLNTPSQSVSEVVFDTDYNIMCNKVLEDLDGNYILACSEGYLDTSNQFSSWGRIIKVYGDFEIISNLIEYPDTDMYFEDMVITDVNKYIAIGGYGHDDGWFFKCRNLIICGFDEELEPLFQNIVPLPDGYFNPTVYLCKADNGKILGVGWVFYLGYNHFFLIKLDENGEVLQTSFPDYPDYDFAHRIVGVSDFNSSKGSFIAFGYQFSFTSSIQAIEIDTNLNFAVTEINDFPNGYDLSQPATAKWLNDSVYLLATADNLDFNKTDQRDLFVSKMNSSHDFIDEPVWLGRQDTADLIGEHGMDFYTVDRTYLAGRSLQDGITPWENNYFIGLIDEGLNVLGTKRIGEPNINYFFNTLCATSDGGCLYISARNDYLNTPDYDVDLHILKLFPDDIITSAPETRLKIDSDYNVYPNPGSNVIYIQTARKGVAMQMCDDKGSIVINLINSCV